MYSEPSQTSRWGFLRKLFIAKSAIIDVSLGSECASKNLLFSKQEQAAPRNTMYCGMKVISQLMRFKLFRLCCAIYMPVVRIQ